MNSTKIRFRYFNRGVENWSLKNYENIAISLDYPIQRLEK